MNSKKTIALTGGGSGGHIIPLLAFYNYLKENKPDKYDFIWVGEEESLEEKIALENKIKFFHIPAGKIRRYFDVRNFYEPLKNLTGIFFGIYYILNKNVDIIFSKGGYVSIPLCISAFILRKKIYIHESDIVMGLANKLISILATKVFYTFPSYKIDNKKHIVSGQILNPKLISSVQNFKIQENNELNVVVIAGSQGSTIIFRNLLKILPNLQNMKFHIILGSKNTGFRDSFEKFENVEIYDFVSQEKLGHIFKNIDIAITRGSATTLWELYFFGIHSIIIPIINVGNHQKKNSDFFAENYGSDVLDENGKLDEDIFNLLNKYKNLRKTGLNLNGFFDGVSKICKEI